MRNLIAAAEHVRSVNLVINESPWVLAILSTPRYGTLAQHTVWWITRDNAKAVTAFVQRTHVGGLDLEPYKEPYGAPTFLSSDFLRGMERNTTITCFGPDSCVHQSEEEDRGNDDGLCAVNWNSFRTIPESPNGIPPQHFESWFYPSRLLAIAKRNRLLRRRVHAAVFRTLSFARIAFRATKPSRLPNEVMLNIAQCASEGVLTRPQVSRLVKHAADETASRRVSNLFQAAAALGEDNRERLRDEWLQNGGFWWDMGYDAARCEFMRLKPRADWDSWPDELSALADFLAFTPPATATPRSWEGANPDDCRQVMEEYS